MASAKLIRLNEGSGLYLVSRGCDEIASSFFEATLAI